MPSKRAAGAAEEVRERADEADRAAATDRHRLDAEALLQRLLPPR